MVNVSLYSSPRMLLQPMFQVVPTCTIHQRVLWPTKGIPLAKRRKKPSEARSNAIVIIMYPVRSSHARSLASPPVSCTTIIYVS